MRERAITVRYRLLFGILIGWTLFGCSVNTEVVGTNSPGVLPDYSVKDESANEGSSINFSFDLSAPTTKDYIIRWEIEFLNTDQSDLVSLSGQVTVKTGDSRFTIVIPTSNDNLFEDDEEFNLILTEIDGISSGQVVAKGTINNDDPPPEVSFQSAAQTVSESIGPVFPLVRLDQPAGVNVFVPYALSGTADNFDHNQVDGVLLIPAGDTATAFVVTITDDALAEATEDLVITLNTPINAALGSPNVHTITINDNDGAIDITSPLMTDFIFSGNETLISVSGTCSTNGTVVTISADDTNGGTAAVTPGVQPTCTTGTFTANLNLASLDDDSITISATHLSSMDNVVLTKDTLSATVTIISPLATDFVHIANETSVAISGNCSEAGEVVTISVDDTNGGTAAVTPGVQPTCTGGNTFSVTLDLSSLDDDNLTVTADHADLAGNGTVQDSVTFVKDTLSPTVSIASPLATDYISAANEITFTVSGACSEAGQEVTISADDTNGGTAAVTPGVQPTCSGGNTFTVNIDLSSLDDDSITITADHVDVATNPATQSSVTLTKDTAAPTVAITSPIATDYINIANENSFTVSGTCSEAGQEVTISADDTNGGTAAVTPGAQPTCSGGNTFTVNIDLSSLDDDSITITADHVDVATNPATQASVTLTKDTAAPTVAITSPIATDYIIPSNEASFTISGTCSEAGQEVTISADDTNGGTAAVTPGVQPTCSGGNTFTVNLDLSSLDDDSITITADHVDTATNPATQSSVTLTKDTAAPTVAITSPIATDYINIANEASFTVSGTCSEAGQEVTISADDTNGGTAAVTPGAQPTCTGGNTFTVNLDLSSLDDDSITITADHVDAATNPATQASVTLTKDTAAPTVAITSPIATDYIIPSNEASFTISGTCSEAGQEVTISADDTNGGTAAVTPGVQPTCSGGNTFTVNLDLSSLDDDSITITADHIDVTTNPATQASVTLTKDTAAPTVAITSPIATDYINIANEASFTVSGTCSEAGQEVTISADDTNGGTAAVTPGVQPTCTGGNTFTVNLDFSSLDDDSITITADHVDVATNPATQSSVTLTKDTAPPAVAIVGQPTGTSNTTVLSVDVQNADGVVSYKYKVGEDASIDCSVAAGYVGPTAEGTDITNDISGLGDVAIELCVIGVDAAGNWQTEASATIATWTKDATAPTAVISGEPSGTNNDTLLSVDVLSTNGVTQYKYKVGEDASIDCSVAGGYLGPIGEGTDITDSIAGLSDGVIELCVLGFDGTNWQTEASATTRTWTKDTAIPTVAITSPIATDYINIANENSFTVSGTCSEAGQEVTISADDTNGGTAAVTPGVQPTCSGGNTFTVNIDLSSLDDDSITITADHVDTATNPATQASVTLIKDTSAPTVAITSPLATDYINIANEASFTVSGTCSEAGQEVTISANDTNGGTAAVAPGVQPTCSGGNTFTVNLDLSSLDDDSVTITADHIDVATNPATQASVTLTKDTGLPNVTITSPIGSEYINIANEASFTVSGTCSENGEEVTISADDTNGVTSAITPGVQPTCLGGSFTVNIDASSLDDDTITITADHSDAGSNSALQDSVVLTKDTAAPTVLITSPIATDYITIANENSFAVSGTCSETGQEVTISADDTNGGTAAVTPGVQPTCSGGNTFTVNIDLSSLDDDSITITADHVDAATNPATQASVTLTKDTAVPTVAITSPIATDYITIANEASFTVSGTCSEAGQEVTISADDTNGGTAAVTPGVQPTCSGGNTFTVNIDLSSLDDDSITISADHVDVATNPATQDDVTLTKDTAAPTVAIEESVTESIGTCSFSSQSDPAVVLPIEFKVTFNEPINTGSLIVGDVTQNGTAGGTTLTWTLTNCGDDTNFSLKATAVDPMGTVIPSISIGQVDDVAGNSNSLASSSVDNSVNYLPNAFLWTGAVNSNWSTGGNWSGGNAPGVSDVATFDGTCGANCNVTVDTSISIAGIDMQAGYTGTITQGAGNTITVGNSGWVQASGAVTFVQNLDLQGHFNQTGGTQSWGGSSKLILNGKSGSTWNFSSTGVAFNDMELKAWASDYINVNLNNPISVVDLQLTGTGASTNDKLNGNNISISGNLTASYFDCGSSTLTINGTNQNISQDTNTSLCFLNINSSGSVSVNSDLIVQKDFTYTSGAITWNGHRLTYLGSGAGNNYTITSNGLNYNNVTFSGVGSALVDATLADDMTISGSLTLSGSGSAGSDRILGNKIILAGNYSDSLWNGGSSGVLFNGTGNQTINSSSTPLGGLFEIAKSSGQVTLNSNLTLNVANQDLLISNGDLDLNFKNLTVNDQLNVGDGSGAASTARLLQGCSTVTAGTTNTNPTDGEIVSSSSNPNVTISDATVTEGGDLVFNISLTEGVCGGDFTVNYTVNDGTATTANSDYNATADDSDATPNDGILTLSSGVTSGTITVHTTTDASMELDETLTVILDTASHGSLTDDTGVGTIENDDDNGFIWTGDTGDGNFSNGANWSNGSTPPGSSDVVLFDDTCNDVPANCDVATSANIDVDGVYLASNYPGTFTQLNTDTITIRTSGWIQEGGSFVGGSGNITFVNGDADMLISAGNFTSTSGTLTVLDNLTIDSAVTFAHNNGTITIDGANTGHSIIDFNGHTLYNFNSLKSGVGDYWKIYVQSNFAILNNLKFGSAGNDGLLVNNFTIDVSGDVDVSGFTLDIGANSITNNNDFAKIRMIGTNPQINFGSAGLFPRASLEHSGTVTFIGTQATFLGHFDHLSGSIDSNGLATYFKLKRSSSNYSFTSASGSEFDDVFFSQSSDDCFCSLNVSGTITVNGDLNLNLGWGEKLIGGKIVALGDVYENISGAQSTEGTIELELAGSAPQTFFQNTARKFAADPVKFNNPTTVSLTSDVDLQSTSLELVQGTLELSNYDLNVGTTLTLQSGTTVNQGCSNLSYFALVDNGATINTSSSNPNITISDATVTEGGDLVFNVSLTEGVCGGDFTVNYTVNDGTATTANSDYNATADDSDATPNDGILTLSSGVTSGTITVHTTTDANTEIDETITVVLDTASHGSLTDDTGVGTIENDDDNGYIWTGDGGDNVFENGANWSGLSAPSGGEHLYFDNTCDDVPSSCNVFISSNISINSFNISSNYSGNIVQMGASTITLTDSKPWLQYGGTFTGGSGDITCTNYFCDLLVDEYSTYTATSGKTTIYDNIEIAATATFDHNNGTIEIGGIDGSDTSLYLNGHALFNLNSVKVGTGSNYSIYLHDNVTIEGNLAFGSPGKDGWILNGYTVDVQGDLDVSGLTATNSTVDVVTSNNFPLIRMTGNNPQINFGTGGYAPRLDLAHTGTLTFAGTSGKILGHLTHSSGAIDANSVDIDFVITDDVTYSFLASGTDLGNVNYSQSTTNCNCTISQTNTLKVNGDFNANLGSGEIVVGGTIEVTGNLDVETVDGIGAATVILNGSGAQEISASVTNIFVSQLSIEKSSGVVSLGTNINLNKVGSILNLKNGDFDLNNFDLTVNDQLNVGDGVGAASSARLLQGCSTVTAGSTNTNPTDGEIIGTSENPSISINDVTALEDTEELVFTVTLSEPMCSVATNIVYNTSTLEATYINGADFVDNDGTLIIPATQTSGTITVNVNADAVFELDEDLIVTLTSTNNGSFSDNIGIGTILNDDTTNYIWTGDAGNNNFNTAGNWSGGLVPGSSDVAYVDDTCSDVPANCAISLGATTTVLGLLIASSYTDTITIPAGRTLTLGSSGNYSQGFFQKGGHLEIAGDMTIRGDFFHWGGTQNWTGSSKLTFYGMNASDFYFYAPTISFNNMQLYGSGSVSRLHLNLLSNIDINGNMTLLGSSNATAVDLSNGYAFYIAGNINATDWEGAHYDGGTTVYILDGSNQSVTSSASFLPGLTINSTGTVDINSSITVRSGFTYNSGTVNWNNNTIIFSGDGSTQNYNIRSNGLTYKHVYFAGSGSVSHFYATLLDPMDIDGNLTFSGSTNGGGQDRLNSSTIKLAGNINNITNWNGGTVNIEFDGAGDQTVTWGSDIPNGTYTVNKPAGSKVILNSWTGVNNTGQDLNILSGDLDLNGHTLVVDDQLNVGDGTGAASTARLLQGCSSVTAGSTNTNPTDGEIVLSSSNPNVTISDATITEGGDLVFNVSLTEGVCGGDFTVNYTVNDGTATTTDSDYNATADDSDATPNDGILTITGGSTSGTITVHTTGDGTMELDETITVVLDTVSHGSLTDDTGVGTIENDDDNGFIWTGDAGDNDFSNGANWSNGSTAPGAGDIAMFDDTCNDVPANCDVDTTTSILVEGLWINTSYPGTITQSLNEGIDVGSSSYKQFGGTFLGGNDDFTTNSFVVRGGTFTATSALTDVTGYLYIDSLATFNHNNGTLTAESTSTISSYFDADGVSFNNLILTGTTSEKWDLTSGNSMTVLNDMVIQLAGDFSAVMNGNVDIYGELLVNDNGDAFQSSTNIIMKGLSGRVYQATGQASPRITIDAGAGTVDIDNELTTRNFIVTSGSININASLVKMVMNGTLNVPANTEFNDLSFTSGSAVTITLTNNVIVNGTTTFYMQGCCSNLNGSTIYARGDIVGTSLNSGTTNLVIDGNTDQNISGISFPGSPIVINKASGKLVATTNGNFNKPGQDLSIVNGDFDLNGFDLTVNDQLNVGDGTGAASTARLLQGCSSVTAGSTNTNPTDGEIVLSSSSPSVSIDDTSVVEGGNLVFTVSLSEGVCATDFTVNYATANGLASGSDFNSTPTDSDASPNDGTLTLSGGATSGTITVATTSDTDVEADEYMKLKLNTPSHGSFTDDEGLGLIINDDGNTFSPIMSSTGTNNNTEWDGNHIRIESTYPGNELNDGSWINTTGLVGYWKLNEDPANNGAPINDSAGANNLGALSTNDGATEKSVTGKVGKGIIFDGVDDYILLADNAIFDPGGAATWCMWAVPLADETSKPLIMQDVSSGRSTSSYKWIGAYFGGGSKAIGAIVKISGTDYSAVYDTGSVGFFTNQWTHICSTFDRNLSSARLKVYVNGILKSSDDAVDGDIDSGDFPLIGTWQDPGSEKYFDGKLDEVSLWHRALTGNEVAAMYNMQRSSYTGIYTSEIIDAGVSQIWRFLSWDPESPYLKQLPDQGRAEGLYSLNKVDMEPSGTQNELLLKFDEMGSPTTFTDSSQAGNDFSCTNCPTPAVGRLGGAMRFDGVNDAVLAGHASLNNTQFTVSTWIRPRRDSDNSKIEEVLSHNVNNTDNKATILFSWDHTTGGGSQAWKFHDGATWRPIQYSSTIPARQWVHILATYDGTTLKTYLNGVYDGQYTGTPLYGNDTLYIGSGGGGGGAQNFFNGDIDEFVVWDKALSDADIAKIYHRGANRVRIQIRSCSDNTCSTDPNFVGFDGTTSTTYDEIINLTVGLPSLSITGDVPDNRYFQYRMFMESDNSSVSPKVNNIRIVGE